MISQGQAVDCASENTRDVAIVGAGIAGARCAALLRAGGRSAVIFEKSRGVGGRLAVRRVGNAYAFDHGAPFVSARGEDFRTFLHGLVQSGAAEFFSPRPMKPEQPFFVGAPGMNAIVKALAADAPLRTGVEVVSLDRARGGWRMRAGETDLGVFPIVVLAAPAPQSAALAAAPELRARIETADMIPCWTVMAAFDGAVAPSTDILEPQSGPLALALRNSAKPGRTGAGDSWVLHARADWAQARLEADKSAVVDALIKAFAREAGGISDPVHVDAHRWRYARASRAVSAPFLRSKDGTLYAAGDWLIGSTAEDAFDSGGAAARYILSRSADLHRT